MCAFRQGRDSTLGKRIHLGHGFVVNGFVRIPLGLGQYAGAGGTATSSSEVAIRLGHSFVVNGKQ